MHVPFAPVESGSDVSEKDSIDELRQQLDAIDRQTAVRHSVSTGLETWPLVNHAEFPLTSVV